MTFRFDSSIVPGKFHFGRRGLGVRGADIPTTGEHGGALLANDELDPDAEYRVEITEWPAGLDLFVDEASVVTASGPDGTYVGKYKARENGLPLLTGGGSDETTFTITIGGATVDLAGAAAAEASASGQLLKGVHLVGASLAIASASGSLGAAVHALAGTATAVAGAQGGITLGVSLSGAALAQASAGASLALVVQLSGAALAAAVAAGALDDAGAVQLAGGAAAQASASAELWLTVPLAGAALAQAQAGGALQVSVPVAVDLVGAAAAQASASARLAADVALSGAAGAQATAHATFSITAAAISQGVAVRHAPRHWGVPSRAPWMTGGRS